MDEPTPQGPQEPETAMPHRTMSTAEPRLDALLDSRVVRPEAVARARELLASATWCRAEEVAAELVDCLVGHRLP